MTRELWLFLIVEGVMSLITVILYGADKAFSKTKHRRIPEKTLLTMTLLLGAPGALVGLFGFHHKTKHWYFPLTAFLGLLLQLAAFYGVYAWTK